jgi:hypothetical protein
VSARAFCMIAGNWAKSSFSPFRTGDRRLRKPEPVPSYTTSFEALAFGKACPQQMLDTWTNNLPQEALDYLANTIYGAILPEDEDCKNAIAE